MAMSRVCMCVYVCVWIDLVIYRYRKREGFVCRVCIYCLHCFHCLLPSLQERPKSAHAKRLMAERGYKVQYTAVQYVSE